MSKLTLKEITDGLKGGALTPRQADKAIKDLFKELIDTSIAFPYEGPDWIPGLPPQLDEDELRQKIEEL
jgi:hypothetical protein